MNQIASPFATWAGSNDTISCVRDERAEETRGISLSLENTIVQMTWLMCLSLTTSVLKLKIWFYTKTQEKKAPKMSLRVNHYPTHSIRWSFSGPNTEKGFHLPEAMSFQFCLSCDIHYPPVTQLVTGTLRTETISFEPLRVNNNTNNDNKLCLRTISSDVKSLGCVL